MEEREGKSSGYELDFHDFFRSFVEVAKTVVLRPSEFYSAMVQTGGLMAPVVFLAVCVIFAGLMANLLFDVPGMLVFKFVIVSGLIFSFVEAGILQLIAEKLFSGKAQFEGTYRVVAYAGAVKLLSWIPVIGFLALLYGFYLQIVGLEKIHTITKGQAVVTIIIAFLAYIVFGMLVGGFATAMR
jgi:hypothetical protein